MNNSTIDPQQLVGVAIPNLSLECSRGGTVSLADLLRNRTVLYVYPATGADGRDPAPGWEDIPGAVGCTAQSLSFKDAYRRFRARGFEVVGLSGQDPAVQAEFAERYQIPFTLVCDRGLALAGALHLPTFEASGQRFYKRITLIVDGSVIRKAFFPIQSAEANSAEVLAWLATR